MIKEGKVVRKVERVSLFGNVRFCAICRKALPEYYEDELCPFCKENQLFSEVKEYIRANDVTEYQVAEHFEISQHLVRKWIAEGRIEYKEQEEKIANLHCSMCGESITFGTLCQKCYREKYHTQSVYAALKEAGEKSRMRYLEKDGKE